MDIYLKSTAGVLIGTILCLFLSKSGKDFSLLLSVAICALVLTGTMFFFEPILEFFQKLQNIANLDRDFLNIVIKAVGIGLSAEIASLICADSGYAAMGKTIQLIASAAILWISIPLLNSLIDTLQIILGEV